MTRWGLESKKLHSGNSSQKIMKLMDETGRGLAFGLLLFIGSAFGV